MPLNAAQLMVNIGGNPTGALTAINAVSGGLSKNGALGVAALGAGAIVAGVGIASVKMAGDFQKGMISIVTGAGESKDKLQMLSQGVLQMARDTGTSTSQLVSGLYMIESGGYRGSTALQILRDAAEGAKVGNADLGVVADATDTILKNFSTTGLTSAQAVNTLIATVAHGKTHMEDLAASLSQVLPTGAAAKIGLNDVMGAMATMTGEGVPAAEAATYLRQTIIALMAPSSGAKKALADIGLTTQQVSDQMHKSLPSALQLIHDHLVKKFPEGSAAYVAAMRNIAGGSKQMQGMLDLGGSHLAAFAQNTKIVADAAKHGGNQITGWSLVQKGFNQQFDRAKEVAETLMISLGKKLLPALTGVMKFIADNAMPTVKHIGDAFQNLGKFINDTGPGATALKVTLGILGGAVAGLGVSLLVGAIPAIWASVAGFAAQAIAATAAGIAVLVAAAPFILIGAAIAGVIALVILAVTHWKQITTALGHFKDMIGKVLGHIGEFVQKGIHFFEDLGTKIMLSVGKFELGVINKAKSLAKNFLDALKELPGKLLSLGENLLKMLAQGLRNGRSAVMDAVKNIPLLGGMAGSINNLIPKFATGGIMQQSGMAMVGENGPELVRLPGGAQVTPLSRLPGGYHSSGFGSSSQPIIVHVTTQLDGQVLARTLVRHIPRAVRNATGERSI